MEGDARHQGLRLLRGLADDGLRHVALWMMQDDANQEIIAYLSCVPRTLERKLRPICTLWELENAP